MANQPLNKNFFIASIFIHLFVMFGISYMIKRDALSNKNFVIFGTHSRHTTKALYKNGAVPFTGDPSRSSGKKGTKGGGKKQKKGMPSPKKSQHKNKAAATQKKSKSLPKPLKQLVHAEQLTMPAPTAMVKESPQSSSKKKSAKKKKAFTKPLPPPPPDEEPESITNQQQELPKELKSLSEELPKEHDQLNTTATEPTQTNADPDGPEAEGDGDSDVIHVGVVDSTDPVTRYHQRIISQEVSRLWHPPAGVRKGTECTVRITIDAKGLINTIDFIKRSQVPIYDLSILRLKITKPDFPPSLHGKHMIVVFHQ